MAQEKSEKKTVELWDGYSVEVNEQLFDDFDFMDDMSSALQKSDLGLLVELYMAVVGGEKTYQAIRDHIIEEEGYFSQKALQTIMEKIDAFFPKAGNRAQRRSWRTTA